MKLIKVMLLLFLVSTLIGQNTYLNIGGGISYIPRLSKDVDVRKYSLPIYTPIIFLVYPIQIKNWHLETGLGYRRIGGKAAFKVPWQRGLSNFPSQITEPKKSQIHGVSFQTINLSQAIRIWHKNKSNIYLGVGGSYSFWTTAFSVITSENMEESDVLPSKGMLDNVLQDWNCNIKFQYRYYITKFVGLNFELKQNLIPINNFLDWRYTRFHRPVDLYISFQFLL